jgi:putative endonuclease
MDMPLPYCVYVLFSQKDSLLYIGFSANVEKRIQTHNEGGCRSTAHRRPLQLIFCEFYLFEEDARNREAYFKTSAGKKAIKYMLADTLKAIGYKPLTDTKLQIEFDTNNF